MTRVLVVDDDPTVGEVLIAYLTRAGFETSRAATGPDAIESARRQPPDAVVLDLMLPGFDGLEVCRRLRRTRTDLPIVMLTARGEEEDRILGLEVGADDYVTKPFSPRELVLRVQAVLRRSVRPTSNRTDADVLTDGDLAVDLRAHRATRDGHDLALTAREYDLLAWFLQHPGEVQRRPELMRSVWGWEFGDESTVTVHVRRLREKIEKDPGNPARLVTVFGVGYRWEAAGG